MRPVRIGERRVPRKTRDEGPYPWGVGTTCQTPAPALRWLVNCWGEHTNCQPLLACVYRSRGARSLPVCGADRCALQIVAGGLSSFLAVLARCNEFDREIVQEPRHAAVHLLRDACQLRCGLVSRSHHHLRLFQDLARCWPACACFAFLCHWFTSAIIVNGLRSGVNMKLLLASLCCVPVN